MRVVSGSITGFGPITPIVTPQAFHLTLSNYARGAIQQPATFDNLVFSGADGVLSTNF